MERTALAACAALALCLPAAAAQEPQLSTFQEVASVSVDAGAGSASAAITLQSTSRDEILLPEALREAVLSEPLVRSVSVTNEDECFPGSGGRSCLLVAVARDPSWRGVGDIHEGARPIADAAALAAAPVAGPGAEFHSINLGAAGGAIEATAAYALPREPTAGMYGRLASLLLHPDVSSAGGFYSAALEVASLPGSSASFTVAASEGGPISQLRVSRPAPAPGAEVRPLEVIGVGSLSRSSYFDGGFYPLNSVVHVAYSSPNFTSAHSAQPRELPSERRGGAAVPLELGAAGWVLGPAEGRLLDARFIFGGEESVRAGALSVSFGDGPPAAAPGGPAGPWWQWAAAGGAAAAAAGAAAYLLRRR